jgi:GrpB-like predicted nucleotidyltransferase (UPF0157 family)
MILAEYNPEWPAWFAALRDRIEPALCGNLVRMHHIGSTAIPGIIAKPIIDMVIEINDYSVFDSISAKLYRLGYFCEGELGIKDRFAFKGKDKTVPLGEPVREWIAHHLYVSPKFALSLARQIAFRDYLIAHEEAKAEYAAIKRQIESESSDDRKIYAAIKEERAKPYIERILEKAHVESKGQKRYRT